MFADSFDRSQLEPVAPPDVVYDDDHVNLVTKCQWAGASALVDGGRQRWDL